MHFSVRPRFRCALNPRKSVPSAVPNPFPECRRPLRRASLFRYCPIRPFVFNTLRTAFFPTPLFSQPSALPPGATHSLLARLASHCSLSTRGCNFLQFIAAIFRTDPFFSTACCEILQRHPGGGTLRPPLALHANLYGTSPFALLTTHCSLPPLESRAAD
jgi:hypothetical protein